MSPAQASGGLTLAQLYSPPCLFIIYLLNSCRLLDRHERSRPVSCLHCKQGLCPIRVQLTSLCKVVRILMSLSIVFNSAPAIMFWYIGQLYYFCSNFCTLFRRKNTLLGRFLKSFLSVNIKASSHITSLHNISHFASTPLNLFICRFDFFYDYFFKDWYNSVHCVAQKVALETSRGKVYGLWLDFFPLMKTAMHHGEVVSLISQTKWSNILRGGDWLHITMMHYGFH